MPLPCDERLRHQQSRSSKRPCYTAPQQCQQAYGSSNAAGRGRGAPAGSRLPLLGDAPLLSSLRSGPAEGQAAKKQRVEPQPGQQVPSSHVERSGKLEQRMPSNQAAWCTQPAPPRGGQQGKQLRQQSDGSHKRLADGSLKQLTHSSRQLHAGVAKAGNKAPQAPAVTVAAAVGRLAKVPSKQQQQQQVSATTAAAAGKLAKATSKQQAADGVQSTDGQQQQQHGQQHERNKEEKEPLQLVRLHRHRHQTKQQQDQQEQMQQLAALEGAADQPQLQEGLAMAGCKQHLVQQQQQQQVEEPAAGNPKQTGRNEQQHQPAPADSSENSVGQHAAQEAAGAAAAQHAAAAAAAAVVPAALPLTCSQGGDSDDEDCSVIPRRSTSQEQEQQRPRSTSPAASAGFGEQRQQQRQRRSILPAAVCVGSVEQQQQQRCSSSPCVNEQQQQQQGFSSKACTDEAGADIAGAEQQQEVEQQEHQKQRQQQQQDQEPKQQEHNEQQHWRQGRKPKHAAASAAAAVPAAVPAAGPSAGPRRRSSGDGDGERGCLKEVRAAVLAAGLPQLPPGQGVLRKDVAAAKKEEAVELQDYYIGDVTGSHRKLFRKVPAKAGSVTEWQQISKSCHDCQVQHINWTCRQQDCRGASVCNRCLVIRYGGLYSLRELHDTCPQCRGVCTCRKCLRSADHTKLLPGPTCPPGQVRAVGEYCLRLLGPLLAELMDLQDAEACAWGYADGLRCVPQVALPPGERYLCDRCGTHIVGLLAHCNSCEWDICSSCIATLRQQRQQTAAAAAADAGAGTAASSSAGTSSQAAAVQGPLTCSNPACCSVPGKRKGAVKGMPAQLVYRRDLFSIPTASKLQLQVLLPQDLLHSLDKLQQLAQEYRAPPQLQLSHCPLLPPEQPPLLGPGGSPITLEDLQSGRWWDVLPPHLQDTWRRRANSSSWLFTPHIDDLQGDGVGNVDGGDGQEAAAAAGQSEAAGQVRALARALFWARWALGEPVIVRGIKGRIPWDPDTLRRAVRDMKAERSGGKVSAGSASDDDEDERLMVIDCGNFSRVDLSQHDFFKGYKSGHWFQQDDGPGGVSQVAAMLKVKDWPPRSGFRQEMQRHFVDFLEALPLRCSYTDPRLGLSPLNLASGLTAADNPTDLGPKCYAAYGRVAEASGEGDSVTKLHVDMADAVNLLMHTSPGGDPDARRVAAQVAEQGRRVRCGDTPADTPSYNGAGAVWDICQRGSDSQRLAAFLTAHADHFTHQGSTVSASSNPMVDINPIFSQNFMLVQHHRELLRQEAGLEMWHFEQHEGEAVFIPGGCPHQVRNLASCCKVAVDFVAPESLAEALCNRQALRHADMALLQDLTLHPTKRDYQEKLQSQLMLLRGALRAAQALQQADGGDEGSQAAENGSGVRAQAGRGGRGGRGRGKGQQPKASEQQAELQEQRPQEEEQLKHQKPQQQPQITSSNGGAAAETAAAAAAAAEQESDNPTGRRQQRGGKCSNRGGSSRCGAGRGQSTAACSTGAAAAAVHAV